MTWVRIFRIVLILCTFAINFSSLTAEAYACWNDDPNYPIIEEANGSQSFGVCDRSSSCIVDKNNKETVVAINYLSIEVATDQIIKTQTCFFRGNGRQCFYRAGETGPWRLITRKEVFVYPIFEHAKAALGLDG